MKPGKPNQRQRPSPPGQVRRIQNGPCVQKFGNPFGGPASGQWPTTFGGSLTPSPAPTPPPTPPPTCVTADILSDCFPCTGGPIDGATPGPACGWTFSEAFGPKGGDITFTPGQMSFNSTANNNVPAALKPISLPSVNNKTLQLKFTEYPAPTGLGNTTYEFYILSAGSAEILYFRLVDDGTIVMAVGPSGATTLYSGPWTPNNGTHTIHLTIDAGGVPTMYIDGVLVPLLFFASGPFITPLPANTASMFFTSGPAFPNSAIVANYFLASGTLPPTTEFCCA